MKRAIVLCRPGADGKCIEQLTQQHGLHVVYTVFTDATVARLAVMIAVEHVLVHDAEAVVVPHLTAQDVWADREWGALAEVVGLVGAEGVLLRG